MMDVAKDQGKTIDPQRLEKKLGIPVVAFSATDVRHYDGFYRALDRVLRDRPLLDTWDLEQQLSQIKNGALLTGECKFAWIDRLLKGRSREKSALHHWGNLTALRPADAMENRWRWRSFCWGRWPPLSLPCRLWWAEVFCLPC